jgi:hypothetical protein
MRYGRRLVVIAVLTACNGGGQNALPDSGMTMDAAAPDAAPDAPPSPDAPPMVDTDGDGVGDGVDVCSTIPDPAQVDLDGDHIGWMCDPVESTMFPISGALHMMPLAVRGNTMGIELGDACMGSVCTHASLSVGPGGLSRADGVSDPWLNGSPQLGFVAAEDHVLWSMSNGVLGDQDASTDTFTSRKTGTILGFSSDGVARYERGPLFLLSSEPKDSSINTFDLLEPQADGSVVTVATSTRAFLAPTIVGTTSPRLVFGISEPGNLSVREFVPGTSSSQPIVVNGTPLSGADVVQVMTRPTLGGMFGFCVDQGGKRYIVETINEQLRAYEAPITTCAVSAQQTNDHQLTLVSSVDSAFFVLNGVLHPLAISEYLELIGTGVPAVITKRNGPTYAVYVVDAAGTLHSLVSDGVASNVSRQGDTLHFLSLHGSTLKLARFRNGTTTEVALPAIAPEENWRVFTTNEGAALATTSARAVVWPSQAATAMPVDFDNIDVLVRGGLTFFVASHNDPRSQPALYVYAEAAGVPRYTALTPEVVQNVAFQMSLYALGYSLPYPRDDLPATDWFMYAKDGDCRIVRPMVTGTTVSLVGNFSCAGGAGIRGVTPSGESIVDVAGAASPGQVYLLDGATMTKVVEARTMRFLYAAPQSPLVLGWTGLDGQGSFLCSAAHPDRCWSTPGDPHTWGPMPAQPDQLHVLFVNNKPGAMVFTSIRSFGPGDRPQPL